MENPSIQDILSRAPWASLEEHLGELRQRVDTSVELAHELRREYREELLGENPEISEKIRRPSPQAFESAQSLLQRGSVAAADGTVAPVPLLGGSKIQIGVVIVFNSGEVVNLVTRVFEGSTFVTDMVAFMAFIGAGRSGASPSGG